jgi:hypothetical protein
MFELGLMVTILVTFVCFLLVGTVEMRKHP